MTTNESAALVDSKTVALFGIPINAMTMDQVLDHTGVVNAARVVNMQRGPQSSFKPQSSRLNNKFINVMVGDYREFIGY